VVLSFAVGFAVGKRSVSELGDPVASTLVSQAPGEELVELLAEVERGAMVNASKQVIYQDVLERRAAAPLPEEAPAAGGMTASVSAEPQPVEPLGDAVPVAPWGVVVGMYDAPEEVASLVDHLRAGELPVWVEQVRTSGEPTFRVGVGGFESEAEASSMVEMVTQRLHASSEHTAAPTVVELHPE
jgi:cell division septation protein DedD